MDLHRPRPLRHTRRIPTALLAALLPLLLGSALAWAQRPAPAQGETIIYLPSIAQFRAPTPAGAPLIESFQLSPTTGPMAGEVELRWRVAGATSLRIDPGVGTVSGAASASVFPVATTTYTLTASNNKGATTATATYTVNALPTPDPLTVAARPDTTRVTTGRIGAAGGTLQATGADGTRYTLSVPPEALLYTETITLTPVAAISGMPFATTKVHAVSIAPEGLLFIEPATLTILPPVPPAQGSYMVGFAYEGAGAEFHLRTPRGAGEAGLALAGAPLALSVVTARSLGAAPVSDPDMLADLAPRAPSSPLDAAEHVAASRQVPDDDLLAPPAGPSYEYAVRPALQNAVRNPALVDSAAQLYIQWRAANRNGGEYIRGKISEANLLLGEALRKAGELATERCNQGRPAQGFALQRYMAYAKRFGLVNTRVALEERLASCWSFRLTFQSRMDQQDGEVTMLYELTSSLILSYQPDGRMIGSAPLSWERFAVTVPEDCTLGNGPHQASTFNADGEGLGLRIEPVSRNSPDINLQLGYRVGQPTAKWTFVCDDLTIPYTSPFWWVAYAQTHSDERQGDSDTYLARASGVNPNGFPGWSYDIAIPGGLGNEHTEIRLEHAPGS